MGQLQTHGKDIFAMLAKGFQQNVISSELIEKFFQIDIMTQPVTESQQEEWEGVLEESSTFH